MEGNEFFAKQNKTDKFKPFMELMLEITNETGCFTDEEIIEETNNIITAGYDTSSTILTIALTILGSDEDIQDRIFNEIIETLEPDTNRDLDKNDLNKYVYTEAFVKETLRLYPIGPVIGRFIEKPIKLSKVYAMLSMKLYLAHIVRRYRIKSDASNMVFIWQIMTRPAGGHYITLERRNH